MLSTRGKCLTNEMNIFVVVPILSVKYKPRSFKTYAMGPRPQLQYVLHSSTRQNHQTAYNQPLLWLNTLLFLRLILLSSPYLGLLFDSRLAGIYKP